MITVIIMLFWLSLGAFTQTNHICGNWKSATENGRDAREWEIEKCTNFQKEDKAMVQKSKPIKLILHRSPATKNNFWIFK